jgi:CheY-like chemotaxis protein
VKDNGSGITPEALVHMFEPFYSTKDVGKGTGMGLSTVHGLVHSYGGHIIVNSTPGSGTTIRLLLPAATEENAQLSSPSLTTAPSAPAGKGELILVVDDEKSLALLLGDILEINGYQAQVFSDSRAALEDFTANPARYAALVTDYTMPGLNGIELTQRILALRADLPVILCSGYSDKLDTAAAITMGVRRYFDKPVKNQVLMQALDELLQE